MSASAIPATPDDLLPWRDRYRLEMRCQIVHDSIHRRPGWTNEYWLRLNEADTQTPTVVGYGSVAVGGPWSGTPTAYEFYVALEYRSRVFDRFQALLDASGAGVIEVQSNDPLASVMLHAFADDVTTQSILFHDTLTTTHPSGGATLRHATADEAPDVSDDNRRWHHVLVVDGETAATGGILFHYNRPYGDIFMEVAEPFRRRGLGTYLVQELKRVCCEGGFVPAARCNPQNVASRRVERCRKPASCRAVTSCTAPYASSGVPEDDCHSRRDSAMAVDVLTETVIRCPPAEVAAYAGNWDNVREWYVNIKAVEWETTPPLVVGSRAAFVAQFLGRRMAYTYEVVELVANERLVMRTAEGPFPMETTYTWASTPEGWTRMTLRNRGLPTGFSRLMAPLMSFAIRRATQKDLARLKTLLEQGG